jgi:hypothetical protein
MDIGQRTILNLNRTRKKYCALRIARCPLKIISLRRKNQPI